MATTSGKKGRKDRNSNELSIRPNKKRRKRKQIKTKQNETLEKTFEVVRLKLCCVVEENFR